jgi:hypothetical protein
MAVDGASDGHRPLVCRHWQIVGQRRAERLAMIFMKLHKID